jgi:glutamate/tyrosine decarboxylase-like PLP-dependent enzyme
LNPTELDRLRAAVARPLPHPDAEALKRFAAQTADWVLRDFHTLPDRPVGHTASRRDMEARLREPPPEAGRPFDQVLAEFAEKVAPFTVRPNHPRFFAFIPSAPCGLAVLAEWLVAGTNYFAGVWLEAAGPTMVEVLVLDWFKQFLGYPAEAFGILTGGGSEANLTALTVARQRLRYEDRARAVLYQSDQRHWSVDRAAFVLGLRPDQLRHLPVTADLRFDARALADAVAEDRRAGRVPWAVVANGGSTSTGTVDPLAALADVCRREGLWFHVDAAYGWPAVLAPGERPQLAGIERADSVTLDPHKWFAQTFEAGCLLVRDGRQLAETFAQRPEYLQDVTPNSDEVNFADNGLALTRRFRALKIWLSLKVLGVGWFRALVERSCGLAAYAEALIRQRPAFEVLHPRQLSVVTFRYVGGATGAAALDRVNLAIQERLLAGGRAFLSSTRVGGRVALRLCFVNWQTTAADVDEVLALVERAGARGAPHNP